MQPDINPKLTIKRIASKEITLFFSSPIAYLFLAFFAAVTLFVFFWGEAFFARNIADIRPLFESMPILLIFLGAALTMRLWSEEKRSGTIEYVFTQAVPLWYFVVGKFLGCIFLLCLALVITLPLPITVSLMGELDWGPVWAGYLATLLMGAAYLSIGLFVSARSENQIVSLIVASALCGAFYFIGTSSITNFVGNDAAEWMRLIGTGSRFDSITRGVVDLRDLYYYLSIIGVFLALNTFALEKERWVKDGPRPLHRKWITVTSLLVLNAIGGNLWIGQLNFLRVDVTQGDQYSISDATKVYLSQLQEPMLIRGYFSAKTHPLLSPLVPQMRDLIREYEIASKGKVRIEFIDPMSEPELEAEANQKYSISPVPFQVADRYQSSIVSSYFNVLVQYGDQHEVLGFQELIEVQARSEANIDVQLRNPEHDLTQAIKKVLQSYQASGNLFDTVKTPLEFNAYLSSDERLPAQLVEFKQTIQKVLAPFEKQSFGRFTIEIEDPQSNDGEVAKRIAEEYGFQPMSASLFDNKQFYFYLTLRGGEQIMQIPLGDLNEEGFKRNLEAGIKRFASGFTKTIALVKPKPEPSPYARSPYAQQPRDEFTQLESFLGSELTIKREDISDGSVSGDADILVLAAPKSLDEKQLFAVDQFLMKGGTVVALTSPFKSSFANRSLSMQKYSSGLEAWLKHHGLSIEEQLVMDPQNSSFPIPVTRNVGGYQLQEMRMLDYPYFIDVRGEGLNNENLITAELPQATLAWSSPIVVDKELPEKRKITELLRSSDNSWVSASLEVMPQSMPQGMSTFQPSGERGTHLLGVVSEGKFTSFYAGKESPLLSKDKEAAKDSETKSNLPDENNDQKDEEETPINISSIIEHSQSTARIILISSNDFLNDQVIRMTGSAQQSEYLNTLQLLANAIDWSMEDSGLLSIRSRGHFNRTLPPMETSSQIFWEYLNYGLAAFVLLLIALIERQKRQSRLRKHLEMLTN